MEANRRNHQPEARDWHVAECALTHRSLLMKGATGYEALARSSLKEYGDAAADALAVAVGCDILTLVPGRVSTETVRGS